MAAAGPFEEAEQEVARRVAAGRADGTYPPELDEQLTSHFARLGRDRLWLSALDGVRAPIDALRSFRFTPAVATDSAVPGGALLHGVVAKLVSRQTLGLVQQLGRFTTTVLDAVQAMEAALREVVEVVDGDLLGDIDAVHARLVAVEQRLARLEHDPSEAP